MPISSAELARPVGATQRGKPMAYDWQNRATARPAAWAEVDAGLRQYMLRVYNYMGAGLALTGLVAYFAAASGFYQSIAHSALIYVVVFAPLALVFLLA